MTARTAKIEIRLTPDEKAAIQASAGSMKVSEYVGEKILASVPSKAGKRKPVVLDAEPPAVEQGRAAPAMTSSYPIAQTWKGRVKQLEEKLPRAAAERIADEEFRG